MLDWIKYRRSLARLDRWERAVLKDREDKRRKALKQGKPIPEDDEQASLAERFMIADDRNLLMSRRLLQLAYRYDLPTPPLDDKSAWDEMGGKYYLTVKARAELRSLVEKAKMERWELVLRVLSVLTPLLVGVIGGLTGLFAILLK